MNQFIKEFISNTKEVHTTFIEFLEDVNALMETENVDISSAIENILQAGFPEFIKYYNKAGEPTAALIIFQSWLLINCYEDIIGE